MLSIEQRTVMVYQSRWKIVILGHVIYNEILNTDRIRCCRTVDDWRVLIDDVVSVNSHVLCHVATFPTVIRLVFVLHSR